MLVNRYFGSKEQLFAEVVADIMARPLILTQEHAEVGYRAGDEIAAALVSLTAAGGALLDGFRIMLLSASSAARGRDRHGSRSRPTITRLDRGAAAAARGRARALSWRWSPAFR